MILTSQEYEAQEKQDKEEQPAKAEQGSGQELNETSTGSAAVRLALVLNTVS